MLFPDFVPFDIPVATPSPYAPRITIHGIRSVDDRQKPPVLLLHGFPQTLAIWHKLAPLLLPHFSIIALDIRGYGQSSKPANHDSPQDHSLYAKSAMAADCIGVMDKLGYENKSFNIIGHDRGGRVAHKLCVDHPNRVSRCMVLDICPTKAMFGAADKVFATAYWHWFFLIQDAPFPENLMVSSPESFIRKALQLPALPLTEYGFFQEDTYNTYLETLKDRDTVHGICEDYRASSQEDIAEQEADEKEGRNIKCPLRVHWGTRGLIEKKFDAMAEWDKVCDGSFDKAGSRSMIS
ncbi:MAG: hypothetical protein M1828_003831 [Chrysothrix sp. TS-e1954]|nr:MAG: hypothetical protein M1828_003831 [Chrysothrix sp. TS-e1954]